MRRLKVSDSRRIIVTEEGRPFFYLGDTAWELFHRLNREDAAFYLRNRAEKRFTVIQAVVLAEFDGLRVPNAYGELPLMGEDPTKPNERYFEHVDWVIQKAGELGLFVGVLPTWGDKVNLKWGKGPVIFTPENARVYGRWLGSRYRDVENIIWINGGDRPVEEPVHAAVWTALAEGLREGDGGAHLITWHPPGRNTSSTWFHDSDWLDFNMWQTGHGEVNVPWDKIRSDYNRTPVKPVMDGEPLYEGHPLAFAADEHGHSLAVDARRYAYWGMFSGGFGHTYGHHSIWQFHEKGREPVNRPIAEWREAMDHPGAGQMRHVRALMESRPFLTRVPDDEFIVPHEVPTWVPGRGARHMVATRCSEGSYAMVYVPYSRRFSVRMGMISGGRARARWYDPRTGTAREIGVYEAAGEREFVPPDAGEALDWVLVVDDAGRGFAPPGQVG